MISGRAVACLGLSQLIGWGISYYLIGNFGPAMQAELGWPAAEIYGGFSWSIVCMALASPAAGRAMDHWGGRRVMPAGALLVALGCALLATVHLRAAYWLAWTVLGLGMRLTLYDAAFAALARAGGPQARRAMSQITLLGGLASTVMWPVGQALAGALGWRGALLAYAGLALATIPLLLALPDTRHEAQEARAGQPPQTRSAAKPIAALYALILMLGSFLAAGNASHLIAMLRGLGLDGRTAVHIAALWGMGQVAARSLELGFGRNLSPIGLNTGTAVAMPLCFLLGLGAGHAAAGALFALGYGACNGLLTIVRGTLPLALFGHRGYGALVGRLLVPTLLATAAAPLAYAQVIARWGATAAMGMSLCVASLMLAASLGLALRVGKYTDQAA